MVLRSVPVDGADLWRRRIAVGLVWGGRLLLVVWPAVYIVARLSVESWMAAPLDEGFPDHWISDLVFGLSFVLGLALPFLVLPIGSGVWLYERPDGTVRVETVLGLRRLEADSVRWRPLLYLPGRGWGLGITSVTSTGRGWVLIADSGAWEDQVAGAKEYLLGIVAIIVWVLTALIAMGLLHAVTFREVA